MAYTTNNVNNIEHMIYLVIIFFFVQDLISVNNKHVIHNLKFLVNISIPNRI